MSNPLLVFWQLFRHHDPGRRVPPQAHVGTSAQASATIFLVMRRMRVPLITLIVIFSVSVAVLTLIPGVDDEGRSARLSLFESFYFMSYTATTIGFGELPWPFTAAQRLWVTFSIYLSVVGWAYAIGSMLTLLQDRSFRQALALQRFTRKVARLREPFFLVAGYGRASELLAKDFDALGQQLVVIDESSDRVDALDLGAYHADIPGLVADAANPHHLGAAGLDHPYCAGVLALTNDDETNLAVTMTAALLRPGLPVVARTISATVAHRMHAFGSPTVINPFDRFGDHLRLALRSPDAFQLMSWLENGPGAQLPPRADAPAPGRWVVCGYGRFGRHFTADLRSEGLEVTAIDQHAGDPEQEPATIIGDASDPDVMARADLPSALGFVAGTDNDTTNLSLVAAARQANPDLFVAARQNQPTNAPLFAAMEPDGLLVPTDVVAHDAYAQLSTPLLWRFLRELPGQGDEWAAEVVRRLTGACGRRLEELWKIRLTGAEAPALGPWLARGELRLGHLMANPAQRDEQLPLVPLLVLRGDECVLTPDGDFTLAAGDQLLFAGRAAVRRQLETTLVVDGLPEYLVTGRRVPSSWVWRRLSRYSRATPSPTV